MTGGYTDLILSRELTSPVVAPDWPAGIQCLVLKSNTDPGYNAFDGYCVAHGFPQGWVGTMLAAGRTGFAVLAQDNAKHQPAVVAGGWISSGAFFIDEIRRTFDPGPHGIYLFGDFVDEAWRGRKLHRMLIRARIATGQALGAIWAHSITRRDNAASLRNYTHEEFGIAAAIGVRFLGPLRFDRCRRPSPALAMGSLSVRGWWLPAGLRVSRR